MKRRSSGALVCLASATLVVACGDTDEISLCPAYDEYVAAADAAIAGIPTDATTAVAAAELVAEARQQAIQLRALADGNDAAPLDQLILAGDDLLATLEGFDPDADFETWRPLIDDTVEATLDADLVVRDRIGPTCDVDTDDTDDTDDTGSDIET